MTTESDKHYPKSKRRLRTGLIQLLQEKPYPEVRITDIAMKSGLTRQTFYFYYRSKEGILQEIIEDLANGLTDLMKEASEQDFDQIVEWLTEPYHPYLKEYFSYMRRHSELILTLLDVNHRINFVQRFDAAISAYKQTSFQKWMTMNGAGDPEKLHMWYETDMKDLVNALFQWVQNGMAPDENTMAVHHTRIWVSSVFLLKDTAEGTIYCKVMDKFKEKGLSLTDWAL